MKLETRVMEVDALRGIAILLMVIYHFFFDLAYLGLADISIFAPEWILFQRVVGTLFISIVGISLTLSESRNTEGYARHAKRALGLAAVALLITAVTWIYPNKGFIMFGIIHFIAAATLIAPFFLRFGRWNVLIGIMIILLGFYVNTLRTDLPYLFWLGIIHPGYRQLDHYSVIPWLGVVLLGIYAGQRLFPGGKARLKGGPSHMDKLAFLGRNSLLIYLVHQPVMFGAMMAYMHLLS
jgi:uncharacterized membrane protein